MYAKFRLIKFCYSLSIRLPSSTRRGYVGAVAYGLPGQGGMRDLHDGGLLSLPFVVWDIICFELGIGRFRDWRFVPGQ